LKIKILHTITTEISEIVGGAAALSGA